MGTNQGCGSDLVDELYPLHLTSTKGFSILIVKIIL